MVETLENGDQVIGMILYFSNALIRRIIELCNWNWINDVRGSALKSFKVISQKKNMLAVTEDLLS